MNTEKSRTGAERPELHVVSATVRQFIRVSPCQAFAFAVAVPWRRLLRIASVALITSTTFAANLRGQALTGTVKEDSTQRALEGAEISLESGNPRTRSAASGRYLLDNLREGRQRIHVRLLGFRPVDMLVSVAAGETKVMDITLVRMPVALDTVATTERSTLGVGVGFEAFDERRRLGFGKFVDSTALRSNENRKVVDLLRQFPGVKVYIPSAPNHFKRVLVSSRAEGRFPCVLDVVMDGALIHRSTGASTPPDFERAFDLTSIDIASLAGIEIYRSAAEIPGVFNGATAACGVLVLWTRRG